VVTGQFAGLVMLGAMMLAHALFLTGDPLMPLKVIGTIAYGDASLRGDPAALLTGFLVHQFGPSLFWGLVFGLLVNLTQLRSGLGIAALGPLVGMASQVVDVEALLRPLTAEYGWTGELLGTTSWFWHVVFGVALCAFPRIREWLFPNAYGR
jgi:hypothetical protein